MMKCKKTIRRKILDTNRYLRNFQNEKYHKLKYVLYAVKDRDDINYPIPTGKKNK